MATLDVVTLAAVNHRVSAVRRALSADRQVAIATNRREKQEIQGESNREGLRH